MDELTLKRLNLVGEDGSLRIVISNETRQHPGKMDGKDLPKRVRPPGIIFFNTVHRGLYMPSKSKAW